MKVFSSEQTQVIDAFTIKNEPISSIDLMERAASVYFDWLKLNINKLDKIIVFAGPGNNGGDAFVVARMLDSAGYSVEVMFCKIGNSLSPDCEVNMNRLSQLPHNVEVQTICKDDPIPVIEADIIVDGIFGSGLNRAVEGYWAELFQKINGSGLSIYAIDIPSGVFADKATTGISIEATKTLSFQFPKFAFFFPENYKRVGDWDIRSIGLSSKILGELQTADYYITDTDVKSKLSARQKFDHKGTYGHACMVGGSYGKMGAITLCSKSALLAGAGLVSVQIPACGYDSIQSSLPEIMVYATKGDQAIDYISVDKMFDCYGIGCGIGQDQKTSRAFLDFIMRLDRPIVIDADALNILSYHKEYLDKIPAGSILTPHMKEFERLFGTAENDFEKNQLQRKMAQQYNLHIILKGAHSCIADPDGICYFNSSGNPGMATAGSGDVLTGILTGLLAQGYSTTEACIIGVYLHGLSADLALRKTNMRSMIASDIISHISVAYNKLET